jgi:hypothetical protein
MVNLFVTLQLGSEYVLFLHSRHAVAIQILVKIYFGDHEMLLFVIIHFDIVVMQSHSSNTVPFWVVSIYEIN